MFLSGSNVEAAPVGFAGAVYKQPKPASQGQADLVSDAIYDNKG
jgi:hypothetical protein